MLCANNLVFSTTQNATTEPADPTPSCGDHKADNSVWFILTAVSNGTTTITLSQIDSASGLTVEAYTGSCGTLSSTGSCNSGSGSIAITFNVVTGQTYYIMVDGNNGNQESFTIKATSSTASIIGRPQPVLVPSTTVGCVPLIVDLHNSSVLSGGTGIIWQWSVDNGVYQNGTGNDTSITFGTIGQHSVNLKVCNNECGCASTTQFIDVEQLKASITAPSEVCIGSSLSFKGTAKYLPDPPNTPTNIVSWKWNFGDPASGSANTANGQNVQHTFTGNQTSFTVTLVVVSADCGTDTTTVNVVAHSKPVLSITPDQKICEGTGAIIGTSATGAQPFTYTWSGTGTFTCASCSTTTVNGLAAGGPYQLNVTVRDSNGCSLDTNTHVYVNPKPTVAVSNDTTVCPNSVVSLLATPLIGAAPFRYSWSPSAGLNNATIPNPSTTVTSTKTYCIAITDSNNCISDSKCVTLKIPPSTNVVANTNPKMICNATPTLITLDGTGSNTSAGTTYSWSASPAVIISNATSLIASATITAPTTFTLTVKNTIGCDTSISVSVQLGQKPTIATANSSFCMSDTAKKSIINVSGAAGSSKFMWDTIPACASPSSASTSSQMFDLSTCTAGNYHFHVTVTDTASGCVTPLSQDITIVTAITLAVTGDTTLCEGDTLNLLASGASTYSWSPSGSTASSISVKGLSTGGSPYTVSVTGKTGSCSASKNVFVIVNTIPKIDSISGLASVCANDSNLLYIASPLTGNYSWTINNGTILSNNNDSIYVKWLAVPSGTLVVIDTNSSGCASVPVSKNISINAVPVTSNITGPDSLCMNRSGAYSVTGSNGSVYSWSVINGSLSGSANNVNVLWTAVGTGIISVYETSPAGCKSIVQSDTVTILPLPLKPSIAGSQLACEGDTVQYKIPSSVGITAAWTVSGGTMLSNTADSVKIIWNTAGQGAVTVSLTNVYGCSSDTALLSIAINPKPQISISPRVASVCANSALPITGAAIGTVKWTTSGTGLFGNDTLLNSVYSPAKTDSGIIVLKVSSTNSCGIIRDSILLTIKPLPTITVARQPSDTICYKDTVALTASGAALYTWLPSGQSQSSIKVAPLSTTTFSVIGNNSGCADTATVTIFVKPPGTPNAGNDIVLCIDNSVQLNGSVVNATGGKWSTLGNGTFSDSLLLNGVYTPGTFDVLNSSVTLLLTSTGACYNSIDTLQVILQKHPSAYAGSDTIITASYSAGMSIPPKGATNYGIVKWTTSGSGSFVPNDSTINADYIPSEKDFGMDSVMIVLTTSTACGSATDYFLIEFSTFVIPNVFTPYPNTPGFNDYFEIRHLPPNSKLTIWDRWGLQVYTSDYYQNDWDAHGLAAEDFYYVLEARGRTYKGWIKVIR